MLLKISYAFVKEQINFGISRSADHMDVGVTLVFLAVARASEADRYAIGLHDQCPYEYNMRSCPVSVGRT